MYKAQIAIQNNHFKNCNKVLKIILANLLLHSNLDCELLPKLVKKLPSNVFKINLYELGRKLRVQIEVPKYLQIKKL